MSAILVLNGPNLDLLGQREPELYGRQTLDDIIADLSQRAGERGLKLSHFQSPSEGELVQRIHRAADLDERFIVFNPAAFTHTSIALRDALLAVQIPFIEVHLSNVNAREDFRRVSYFSDIAHGTITGLGPLGYRLALDAALAHLA